MRAILSNDPFWLTQEQISSLTSRQVWEWYIKPAQEQAARWKAKMDGETKMPEMSDEAMCGMLEMMGILTPRKETPKE